MVDCSDFLREFSDFRDGYMDPGRRALMESHVAACAACAGYVQVLDEGVEALRSLPAVEPSYDFLPRLQHRIYHVDDERAWLNRSASGTSVGFVLLLILMVGAATWIPLLQPRAATIELPPIVAQGPRHVDSVHTLFKAGPLLTSSSEPEQVAAPAANTLFFRYTRLGSNISHQTGYFPRR